MISFLSLYLRQYWHENVLDPEARVFLLPSVFAKKPDGAESGKLRDNFDRSAALSITPPSAKDFSVCSVLKIGRFLFIVEAAIKSASCDFRSNSEWRDQWTSV